MAIRYIAMPTRLVPGGSTSPSYPVPVDVRSGLAAQLDLRQLPSDPSLVVYENTAWGPVRAATESAPESRLGVDLSAARPVLPGRRAQTKYNGTVPAGNDVLVSEDSGHWSLDVGGHRVTRHTSFGWANRFQAGDGGRATLSYGTPLLRYLALLVELVLWIVAIRALRARRRQETRA
jgi:hypothetical protein